MIVFVVDVLATTFAGFFLAEALTIESKMRCPKAALVENVVINVINMDTVVGSLEEFMILRGNDWLDF